MPQPKSSGSSSSRSSGSGGAAAKRSSSSGKTAAKRSSSSGKTAAKRSSSGGKTAAKSSSAGKTAAKSSSAGKSAAKSSSAGKSTAKASASRAKPAAAKSSGAAAKKSSGAASGKRASAKGSASRSTAKRSPAKPAAKASGRSATAAGAKPSRASASARTSTSTGADAAGGDDLRARMAEVRERLLGSVTIPASRLQEAVDETVRRGRMTRADAEELVTNLLSVGRTQTEAVLADIEQLLGRGRQTASRSGDRVLRQVDKARRAAGIGGFPVMGYDDLTAGQIADRLGDLTPAQLRKVRDYERRNANRKSVLQALEKRLA